MGETWLSVIIPAYNCSRTIERLLDSVIMQGDPTVEVLICDDNSTDNFMEKVEPFKALLNIRYMKTTPREIHCPGNTRMDAWKHANGEWITFIDNDDTFEPFTFYRIKDWIQSTGESRMLHTKLRSVDPETGEYKRSFDAITWMHGKFYNKNWLLRNGIDFKEDLEQNEDLYFNTMVNATLMKEDATYTIADYYSYKWYEEAESLSRKMHNKPGEHTYAEMYFQNYIFAASEPWFIVYERNPEMKDLFFDKLAYIVLHAYLYYQEFVYRWKDQVISENLKYIKNLVERVKLTFDKSTEDIINHIYLYGDRKEMYYQNTKAAIANAQGSFVETKSFLNFMLDLDKEVL